MRKLLFTLFTASVFSVYGQFELSGQFRPRAEFRQGFKELFGEEASPAFFIDQRTRLNSHFKNEKIQFGLVVQDYRTWGNTSQLNLSDNGLSIHEAWGKLILKYNCELKLGRQEIVFDNARIFGNVDWAQQGRKHDALLFTYQKKHNLNIGLAYNSANASLTNTGYSISNNYKTLATVRQRLNFKNTSISLLFVNTGRNGSEPFRIYNEQTSGFYLSQKINSKFKLEAELYYQSGRNKSGEKKSAYMTSLNVKHQINDNFFYKIGSDLLSGHNYGEASNGFDPLFGTHHKFYGHMDYFYVGNSHGNNGLQDHYITLGGKLKKSSAQLTTHYFLSNNPLNNEEKNLGVETDLSVKCILNEYASLSGGYSIMIADENMRAIKQGFDLINHWGWLMLDIKASFFKTKKK